MLSYLVNKPNRVYQTQRLVQESHEPIYYRLPRSHLYLRSYYTLFGVGMVGVTFAAYNMIMGKKAE